jgi:hypothetical protein
MDVYYPAQIWLAFGQTFTDKGKPFDDWLMHHGYPELSALSHAIRGSEEALAWLMKNKFFHLAAVDSAIDDDSKAFVWLKENGHPFLVVFADAVRGKPYAIEWLVENDLPGFVAITKEIKAWRDSQTFDYHKKHF